MKLAKEQNSSIKISDLSEKAKPAPKRKKA